MAWKNPKTNWRAGDGLNSGDFNRIEGNILELDKKLYGVASGTNNYAVTIDGVRNYVAGLKIYVKFVNASTSTSNSTINVNNLGVKNIIKPNGTNVSNLKGNGVYGLVYDGTVFQLQGEGGEGTAVGFDVIEGKTFTNDDGLQTGYMPDFRNIEIRPSLKDNKRLPRGHYLNADILSLQDCTLSQHYNHGEISSTFTVSSGDTREIALKSNVSIGEYGLKEPLLAECKIKFINDFGENEEFNLIWFYTGWSHIGNRSFSTKRGSYPNNDLLTISLYYSEDTDKLSLNIFIFNNPSLKGKSFTATWEIRGLI